MIVTLLVSCFQGDSDKLSIEEKYTLDTIYANSLSNFRIMGDSLCNMQKDSFYKMAVDSIKKERIAEIELLTGIKESLNDPNQ